MARTTKKSSSLPQRTLAAYLLVSISITNILAAEIIANRKQSSPLYDELQIIQNSNHIREKNAFNTGENLQFKDRRQRETKKKKSKRARKSFFFERQTRRNVRQEQCSIVPHIHIRLSHTHIYMCKYMPVVDESLYVTYYHSRKICTVTAKKLMCVRESKRHFPPMHTQ